MLKTLSIQFVAVWLCLIDFQSGPAHAQQASAQPSPSGIFTQGTDPNADAAAPATPKLGKKVKAGASATKPARSDAASASSNDIEGRLQALEEQTADMQVAVGTIESLGKGHGSGGPQGQPAGAGGDSDVRVGRLEAQMQNLNAQLTDLANQLHAMEQRLQPGNVGVAPSSGTVKMPPVSQRPGITTAPVSGQQASIGAILDEQPPTADSGFGQTTVSQEAGLSASKTPAATAMAVAEPVAAASATPALVGATDPQGAYDQAYGLILQQDYAGAEAAFRGYIDHFPQSPLGSNANYWLGQSYYARGQYKPAADAFLRGYKSFRTGAKASDSLLKVGMSLSRLGQKDLACSALTALDGEFPNASPQIKHLAQAERERAGC